MKNKKNLIKIGAISFVIGCLGLSFSSAVTLHLTGLKDLKAVNKNELTNKIIQIHFADNGNNFGGFIYYGNIDEESTTEPGGQFQVGVNNDFYECKNQLKGFYYNAERGERLWPLDEYTKGSRDNSLTMSGGIYTACALSGYDKKLEDCTTQNNKDLEACKAEVNASNEADGNGYFGSVSHTYSGKDMRLIIGVRYDPADIDTKDFIKIYTGTTLFPSFKRLSNKYPVGFIYDYNGGVGLAGCHIEEGYLKDNTMSDLIKELNDKRIDDMFIESNDNPDVKVKYIGNAVNQSGINCSSVSTEDTLSKVVIEGIVGASDKGSDYDTIFTQMGNQSDQKMQYFTTANVDNDTLMNYARKKAEILCRGKWGKFNHIGKWEGKVVCIKDGNITAYESNQIKNAGKTLIIKNGDVTIKPMTGADRNTKEYYDIFIDKGNLYIQENNENIASGTNEELFIFTKEGFISGENHSYSGFNEALSGAGIYYNKYSGNDIAVGAYIRGNFIVNGKVKGEGEGGKLKHKYFIYGKFSTLDGFKDLEETFSWRCHNQISNEEYKFFCPKIDGNPYVNAALVIIDQNYPSTFYNN